MDYLNKISSGRIGRMDWFLGCFMFGILNVASIAIVSFFIKPFMGTSVSFLLIGIVYLITIVYQTCLYIRRFHDINKSGWSCFFFLIPLVNLVFFIILLTRKGDEGQNQYGEPVASDREFLHTIFNTQKEVVNPTVETPVASPVAETPTTTPTNQI